MSYTSTYYNRLSLVFCRLTASQPVYGIAITTQFAPSQTHKIHCVQTVQSKQDTL